MRNKIIFIILGLGLVSCASDKYSYKDYKAVTTSSCSQLILSENKINRIDLPDIPRESPSPAQSGFKKIDSSINASADIGILKDNKFITLYTDTYSHILMGKVFDKSGEEIVKRFKLVETKQNEQINYKLVTDKRLDYFLVFYLLKNGVSYEKEFFVKKFDLFGNQISNEVKLDIDTETFFKATYSFDQDGKNLILSWMDTISTYEGGSSNCIPFLTCGLGGTIVSHFFATIKYIKFDDNFNYCFNSIGLKNQLTDRDSYTGLISYITNNREKIIFPLNYTSIKEVSLKDNKVKDIVFMDTKQGQGSYSDNFIEDDQNYYFINRYDYFQNQSFSIYKLDKDFNIIGSRNEIYYSQIKTLPIEDLKTKSELYPGIFFDSQLNIFRFENLTSVPFSNQKQSIFELDDKLLYINGDSFTIL